MPSGQHLAWALAFGIALFLHGSAARGGHLRFALGLWLGALLAHLGWAALHLPAAIEHRAWILHPGAASVLFLPLGVLLLAPWREALAALPIPLLVARLGCLPYGCCYPTPAHAIPELVALVAMHGLARSRRDEAALIVLAGFGALRLLCEPLRVARPEVAIDPEWIAAAWIVAGVGLRHRLGDAPSALAPEAAAKLRSALLRLAAVWSLFVVCGRLFADPHGALLVACGASVLAVRPPSSRRPGEREGLCALGPGLLLGGAGVAVLLAALPLAEPGQMLLGAIRAHAAAPPDLRWWLAIGVLAPLFEERLYRGWLLEALAPALGSLPAALCSTALFALSHVQPVAMAMPLAMGLVNAALRLRGYPLALAIGIHAGANLAVATLAV